MTDTLVGASVWEQGIYNHLLSHVEAERGILESYRDAAERSESSAFRYLVNLIVEDEIRHHKRFSELAEALRSDAELSADPPVVPRLDWYKADRKVISELTDGLLAQEKADAKELERLRRELKDVKDTTMWVLLVKLMEADTAKHLEILNFIRHHISL